MFLETYLKVRKVFRPPKFSFFIGKWKNEPNLPVWRRGKIIQLTKNSKDYTQDWDYAKLKSTDWTEEGRKNHPILSRLFKPMYVLPIWLSFYVFNYDIWFKVKWEPDDYRYEFPASFTIVFFGLAVSITADEDCLYWESILTYLHYKGDIKKTCDRMGIWTKCSGGERYFGFNYEFLKDKQLKERLKQYQYEVLHNSKGV